MPANVVVFSGAIGAQGVQYHLDNLTPNVARLAFPLAPSLSVGGDGVRRLPLPIQEHDPVGRAVWLHQIYSGGDGTSSGVEVAIKCSSTYRGHVTVSSWCNI